MNTDICVSGCVYNVSIESREWFLMSETFSEKPTLLSAVTSSAHPVLTDVTVLHFHYSVTAICQEKHYPWGTPFVFPLAFR